MPSKSSDPCKSCYKPGTYLANIYRCVHLLEATQVLEIGFYNGDGASAIMTAMRDQGWAGRLVDIEPSVIEQAKKRIAGLQTAKVKWELIEGRSQDVRDKLSNADFDLIYFDGDHAYDAVKLDAELYLPLTRFALFDDVHLDGPRRIVEALMASGEWNGIEYDVAGTAVQKQALLKRSHLDWPWEAVDDADKS
jgi:predicted O-methyltransferase YrrM